MNPASGAERRAPERGEPAPDDRIKGRGVRKWALTTLVLSALAITVAYVSAFLPGGTPAWAPWIFMVGMVFIMVGTMAVGAVRDDSIGVLWIPFGLILVILLGGFGLVLALPPADPGDPALWLGLPPRAAVIMYGIGLFPFFLLPVAYAWTFDHLTLKPGDLERIRDEALQAQLEMRQRADGPAEPFGPAGPATEGGLDSGADAMGGSDR